MHLYPSNPMNNITGEAARAQAAEEALTAGKSVCKLDDTVVDVKFELDADTGTLNITTTAHE